MITIETYKYLEEEDKKQLLEFYERNFKTNGK